LGPTPRAEATPYIPSPPPTGRSSHGRNLGIGLGIGAVAVIAAFVLLIGAVTLVGRKATDTAGTDASGSQSTAPPLGAIGTVPDRTPTTIGVGNCGPIPDVTPLPGPDDPDLLISPAFVSDMDVSALEHTYGPLTPELTVFPQSVDEAVDGLDHPSLEETRAELLADGYRGTALRRWRSQRGDSVAVLNYAVADAAGAQRLTRLLLIHACSHSSPIAESTTVPGALVFFDTAPGDPNGMPRARFVADIGNTEVNVTLCTCRPGDEALATAELWVKRLVQSLQAGRA
jgi:hypothetical protein